MAELIKAEQKLELVIRKTGRKSKEYDNAVKQYQMLLGRMLAKEGAL